MLDGEVDYENDGYVPTIRELIRTALDTGKSVRELEEDSGYLVKFQTFQELSNRPPKQFPKNPETIAGMAAALHCPEATVVLAYAKGLGIDVDTDSEFALRLPRGVDALDTDLQNALVAVIRAAVKQHRSSHGVEAAQEPGAPGEAGKDEKTLDEAKARARGSMKRSVDRARQSLDEDRKRQ